MTKQQILENIEQLRAEADRIRAIPFWKFWVKYPRVKAWIEKQKEVEKQVLEYKMKVKYVS